MGFGPRLCYNMLYDNVERYRMRTMQPVIDILHSLARQQSRGESSPLALLRPLPERSGERISHLPMSQRLSQAWIKMTGAPFRPHQSLALSSLRRGEPFALIGGSPSVRKTLQLLMYEILHTEPEATALLAMPDDTTALVHQVEIARLSAEMGAEFKTAHVGVGPLKREALTARVLLATPEALHRRLLRHHDRAWGMFWRHLRVLFFADAHRYCGVGAAHLAALLTRIQRLAPGEPPLLAATLAPLHDADQMLFNLTGQTWRIISVDDAPRPATAFGLWQSGGERLRDAALLALAFQREGISVHIVCDTIEIPLLQTLIGADNDRISISGQVQPAQAQLFAGSQADRAAVLQSLDSGAALTLVLLGDALAERVLARLAANPQNPPPFLDEPLPAWGSLPSNAYVTAQHLLCAASEHPLTTDEAEALDVVPLVERLQQNEQLALLPDETPFWQPLPAADDPYAGFALNTASGATVTLCNEQGVTLGDLPLSCLDRWGFVGAALPPGRSSYRVTERDDEEGRLTLRAEDHGRRTAPLRRCTVRVRDERESRVLRGRAVGWGRVVIDEEIYGYRESQPRGAPTERALSPTLEARWTAPALWIDLQAPRGAVGQLAGWTLAAALPLRLACNFTDLVPAYDDDRERIYLIDAHPGGNGVSAWAFANLEALLPLAYDIALANRNDPLLEPLAQADKDWLLALLGGDGAAIGAADLREPAVVPARPPAEARSRRAADPPEASPPASRGAAPEAPARSRRAADPPEASPPSRRSRGRRANRNADEQRDSPPARSAPKRAPEPETPSDPRAMAEKLRRMREQREAREAREQARAPAANSNRLPVTPIFAPGDEIFCLPYGYGKVLASRTEEGRELLAVEFPDYGELTIDPAVSGARRIEKKDADDAAS